MNSTLIAADPACPHGAVQNRVFQQNWPGAALHELVMLTLNVGLTGETLSAAKPLPCTCDCVSDDVLCPILSMPHGGETP